MTWADPSTSFRLELSCSRSDVRLTNDNKTLQKLSKQNPVDNVFEIFLSAAIRGGTSAHFCSTVCKLGKCGISVSYSLSKLAVKAFISLFNEGIKLRPTNAEVARVGLAVAAGDMKYQELLDWILENEV